MFSLQDKVRTESYRDFMYRNPDVFKDKVGWLEMQRNVCLQEVLGSVFDMQPRLLT